MAPYKVILAYDGTDFEGFQRQGSARTVQLVVEDALRCLNWQGRTILAAGRTDTGVHAAGQVVAFEMDWAHSTEQLGRALNANLPHDVSVKSVETVDVDFHPRFSARARTYQYHLYCEPERHPLYDRFMLESLAPTGTAEAAFSSQPSYWRHTIFLRLERLPKKGGARSARCFRQGGSPRPGVCCLRLRRMLFCTTWYGEWSTSRCRSGKTGWNWRGWKRLF